MAKQRKKLQPHTESNGDQPVVDAAPATNADFTAPEELPSNSTDGVMPEIQAKGIIHGVADATRVPDDPERRGFAEATPRRTPGYCNQGIIDKLAGASLIEHHNPFFSIIRFEEKPSDAVKEMLHEASFRWSQENREWNRQIRYDTRQQDRIGAERVFEDICRQIREERGITHDFGGAS